MSMMHHRSSYLNHWPLGVVAVISPWNYPFFLPLGDIVMALVWGNAVGSVLNPEWLAGSDVPRAFLERSFGAPGATTSVDAALRNDTTVMLVDDGLATGSTMRAAARALRSQEPAKVVVAVPVAAPETCDAFREEVDEIVCALTPEPFHAVGLWYEDFSQTTDEEVRDLLDRAARQHPVSAGHS